MAFGNLARRDRAIELGASGRGLWPMLVGIVTMMLVPIGVLVRNSLENEDFLESLNYSGPLANYRYLLSQDVYLQAFYRTLWISLTATVISVLIAYLCAIALRTCHSRAAAIWSTLLLFSFVTGPLINVVGWMGLLAAGGPGYSIVHALTGQIGSSAPVLQTTPAVLIGILHFDLPFALLTLAPVVSRVPGALERAALTLGGGRFFTFRRVFFPLTLPAISSALALCMALSASAFVAPHFLGGDRNLVATTLITQQVQSFAPGLAAAAAVILLVLTIPLFAIYVYYEGRRRLTNLHVREVGEPVTRFPKGLNAFILGLTVIFLNAPILMAAFQSVNDTTAFPAPFRGFTLDWYGRLFRYEPFGSALANSAVLGVTACAIALVVAGAAAIAIARGPRWTRGLGALTVTTAPTMAPELIVGLAFFQFANQLRLEAGWWLLIPAHTLLVAPFMLRVLQPVVATVDGRFELAAATLGASSMRTFRRVFVPPLKTAVFGACLVGFTLSFINLPLTLFLGTPGTKTIPLAISEYMETRLDPLVACFATVQAVVCIALFTIAQRVFRIRLLS